MPAITPVRKPDLIDYANDIIGGIGDLVESKRELNETQEQLQKITDPSYSLQMKIDSIASPSNEEVAKRNKALLEFRKQLRKVDLDDLSILITEARANGASNALMRDTITKISQHVLRGTGGVIHVRQIASVIPIFEMADALAMSETVLKIRPEVTQSMIKNLLDELYPNLRGGYGSIVMHCLYPEETLDGSYQQMVSNLQSILIGKRDSDASKQNLEDGLWLVQAILVAIFVIVSIVLIGIAIFRG